MLIGCVDKHNPGFSIQRGAAKESLRAFTSLSPLSNRDQRAKRIIH
jgi:hypothetical protein